MSENNIQAPSILITGTELNFRDISARDTNQVIKETIDSARSEKQESAWFHMLGFIFTKDFAALQNLKDCLARGTKTKIIINKLLKSDLKSGEKDFNTGRDILYELNRDYDNLELFSFKSKLGDGDLHAKTIVANRSRAIVGSANFSVGGLDKNYELGLYVTGHTAYDLAGIIDSIASNSSLCTKIKKNQQ